MAQAFELLITGMITVFLVLGLVVLLGKFLIRITNRWQPEKRKTSRRKRSQAPRLVNENRLQPEMVAVLTAAVEIVTNGEGAVTQIDQLPHRKH